MNPSNHTTKITIQDFLISVGFIRSKRRNMWNVGSVSGEFKLYFIIIFLCIIKWVSMCNPLEPGYKCSCSLMTIHISQILKIAEETKWRTTTEYQKFVPRSSASIQAATYAELLKRQLLLWTASEIVRLKKGYFWVMIMSLIVCYVVIAMFYFKSGVTD